MQIFSDSSCKSYKTERFCSAAGKNVTLSVAANNDGKEEAKSCQDFNSCKYKEKCKYNKTT